MGKIRIEVNTTFQTADGEQVAYKFGKLLSALYIVETEEDGYVHLYLENGRVLPYVDKTSFSTIGDVEIKKYEDSNSEGSPGKPGNQEVVCEDELQEVLWEGGLSDFSTTPASG